MRSRAALILLALLALALPLSHLQLQQVDQRWLLLVDGRPVDLAGQWSERMNRMRRDCRNVRSLSSQETLHMQAVRALQQQSPPHSRDLRLLGLWHVDGWLLAEVDFERLAPAVVLLHSGPAALDVVTPGVWTGATHPHWPSPFIRDYLARQVPEAPVSLLACYEPILPLFRSGRPAQPHDAT